jgi:FtsP/CotA-like multicopper oxidase with cupredoxin domain
MHAVEPRRYRFRLLNGCNSRFLILKLVKTLPTDPESGPVAADLPFWQIGSDGGFLPAPVRLQQVLMAPAERADLIVDFTGLAVGTEIYLINEGPDEPFGGGEAGEDFDRANPDTTGQVMKFVIAPLASRDLSIPPERLVLPAFRPLGAASNTRQVSLNEQASSFPGFDGPVAAQLGTLDADGNPVPLGWDDAITENPALNTVEVWEMYNFTEDAHPIHIHEVQFQVVNRESVEDGSVRGPEPSERGYKDTVIAYPEQITRVKALFDLPGLYVWHCHIVEHEDNEMMRPYHIGPIPGDLPL